MPGRTRQRKGPGRTAPVAGAVAAIFAATVATLAVTALPATAGVAKTDRAVTIEMVTVPRVGSVLATSSGRTLYRVTGNAAASTCTGACAKVWIPLLLPQGDHLNVPHGLQHFSTIHLAHGRRQVSFRGVALYRFAHDTKKGQAKGQGFEGKWFAVVPRTLRPASAAPTSTSTAPATSTVPPTTTTPARSTPAPSGSPTTTPVTAPPPPPTTVPPPPTTTTTSPGTGGAGF